MDDERYTVNEDEPNYILDKVKYCIISDYNKGYLHNSQQVVDYCKQSNCIVIVDPKKPIENYKRADIVKLNHKEFKQYCASYSSITEVLEQNDIGTLIITQGANGASIHTRSGFTQIKAEQHQVSDVTGAGDVFIAVLTHFLSKGLSIENACKKAVILASVSVTKFGTYTLQPNDIKKAMTVFTNGCFDILHRGHIEYLKRSKDLGNKLIVGLNSDTSVRRLKGQCRPINNQEDRAAVLESLDCVDEVIIFDKDTPYDLIKAIAPDIITKGGDYKVEDVVGRDLADVKIIPYNPNYSTTKILEKISG
jgi:D-beta-D-heptose 7-phosphate kinase/D-beta-D-heptose 1-phosphate adenosyltransferase